MIIPKNHNILEFLQNQKIDVIAPCNGKGLCGKCKVLIHSKPKPNKIEMDLLSITDLEKGIRLACTRTTSYDTEITNLANQKITQIVSDFNINYQMNPYLKLKKTHNYYEVYRNDILIAKKQQPRIFGASIDIGTTTVVIVLYDLGNLVPIEIKSFLNPQSKYGSDVISRIQFTSNINGLNSISEVLTSKIDSELNIMLVKNGISKEDLFDVIIAGNTTMNYLLLKIDPTSLAIAPYKADFLNTTTTKYYNIFNSNVKAEVTVLGGFDAFVGGDILSGIYSENLHKKEKFNMLIGKIKNF